MNKDFIGSKLKIIKIYLLLICCLALVSAVIPRSGKMLEARSMYLAAAVPDVTCYTLDEGGAPVQSGSIPRGTAVSLSGKTAKDHDGNLLKGVRYEGGEVFVDEENLTADKDDVVLEDEVYVRTPATIYSEPEGPEIAGFVQKGESLRVTGYDAVEEDGTVDKYRISYEDSDGWIYGKYMVFSPEEAKKKCNDNGAMDMAKDSSYPINLHGGKGTNLDYFPYEKTSIPGKAFCTDARAMYLNAGAATKDKYFKLAADSGVNAVVINIDGGTPAYGSPVMKELCPTAYESAHYSLEEYQKAVNQYKEAGFYTIGRIACFNDKNFAKDHPESCIKEDGKSTGWVSAYSRKAWEYKVSVAVEAVELLGFDEIQFDYVRFPETAYQMSLSGSTDFGNTYDEEKAQAIQNFCFYAADQIHEAGAYFSVDVFGECSNGYVTAYGQYWPAISNVVDAISSMPYTDHHGDSDTWTNPYSTMYNWAKRSAGMQKHIPTPAVARTWITGYNTPYWNPTVNYNYDKLNEQVKALKDAGLDGGFIPWNSSSDYRKYKEYSKIWQVHAGDKKK